MVTMVTALDLIMTSIVFTLIFRVSHPLGGKQELLVCVSLSSWAAENYKPLE